MIYRYKVYDLIWDSPLTQAVVAAAFNNHAYTGLAVDLGCGTGLGSGSLVKSGWHVIGVDKSEPMLLRAMERGRISKAVLADAEDTGLATGLADLVLVDNLLHLHPDPHSVLVEASRLVKPDGSIVCVWPLESVSLGQALLQDLASGRNLAQSLIAATLRLAVGVYGACVGARRWPSETVDDLVSKWSQASGARLLNSGTVLNMEIYAVYELPFIV